MCVCARVRMYLSISVSVCVCVCVYFSSFYHLQKRRPLHIVLKGISSVNEFPHQK